MTARYGPQNTKVKEIEEQISQVQNTREACVSRVERVEIRDLLDSTERSLKSIETMRGEIKEQFDRDLVIAKKTEIDLLTETSPAQHNLERQRTALQARWSISSSRPGSSGISAASGPRSSSRRMRFPRRSGRS